jgi:hypothetical protein
MKPLVYLAAFREGLDLDSLVPDEPIQVELGSRGSGEGVRQLRSPVQGFDGGPAGAGRQKSGRCQEKVCLQTQNTGDERRSQSSGGSNLLLEPRLFHTD